MTEAVAIAGLHKGQPWRHRRQQLRGRRGLAAVMGHQQDLTAQRPGRGLDITGQQGRTALRAAHPQHTGQRIAPGLAPIVLCLGMQQLEAHAIPLPGLSLRARPVLRGQKAQRMPHFLGTVQGSHWQALQQRARAADMVAAAMAEHQ